MTLDGSPLVDVTGSTYFTVTAEPTSSVAGGSSTTFTVTFAPIISGDQTATISIANNDADEDPYTFKVTGNGEPAVLDWTVTFQTDGTSGATLDGTVSQTIADGGNCTAVRAKLPDGYAFDKWTVAGGGETTNNPVTVTTVTADMTLTAEYVPATVITLTDGGTALYPIRVYCMKDDYRGTYVADGLADVDGKFAFTGLDAGTAYKYNCWKDGTTYWLEAGVPQPNHDFEISGTVVKTITMTELGVPIDPQIRVYAFQQTDTVEESNVVTAAGTGEATFNLGSAKSYRFFAWKDGVSTWSVMGPYQATYTMELDN